MEVDVVEVEEEEAEIEVDVVDGMMGWDGDGKENGEEARKGKGGKSIWERRGEKEKDDAAGGR